MGIPSATYPLQMNRDFSLAKANGIVSHLAQALLKIASPGVPDIDQGNELWDLSLVDPDNRRPVDYEHRLATLTQLRRDADLDAGALAERLLAAPANGRVNLLVTYRALGLRRARSDAFEAGSHSPLSVLGARSRHAIAFARGEGRRSVIAIFGRFFAALRDPLSGQILKAEMLGGQPVPLSKVFARLPVALLEAMA